MDSERARERAPAGNRLAPQGVAFEWSAIRQSGEWSRTALPPVWSRVVPQGMGVDSTRSPPIWKVISGGPEPPFEAERSVARRLQVGTSRLPPDGKSMAEGSQPPC